MCMRGKAKRFETGMERIRYHYSMLARSDSYLSELDGAQQVHRTMNCEKNSLSLHKRFLVRLSGSFD
jgi:hypothetical protein